MRISKLIAITCTLLCSFHVLAQEQEVQEVKYVTDQLRLSLYKQASDKSGSIKLLVSGDVLDVLEKQGPYSKVKTREGDIGWVKNGFLLSTPTASYQLIEEQKKNEILVKQLEQYADSKKLVEDYETTISKISDDFAAAQQALHEAEEQVENLTAQNDDLAQQIDASQQGKLTLNDVLLMLKQYWYFAIAVLVVLFISGFVIGRVLVEAQVKRRFQGVKVW
jgi:SH3 domain protein